MHKVNIGGIKFLMGFFSVLALGFFVFGGNFQGKSVSRNVSADTYDKINILPGEFSLGGESQWKNVREVFVHDLNADSSLSEFNNTNSAYILVGYDVDELKIKNSNNGDRNDNEVLLVEDVEGDSEEEVFDNEDTDKGSDGFIDSSEEDEVVEERDSSASAQNDSFVEVEKNESSNDSSESLGNVESEKSEKLEKAEEEKVEVVEEEEIVVDSDSAPEVIDDEPVIEEPEPEEEETIPESESEAESTSDNSDDDKQTNNFNGKNESFVNRFINSFKTLVSYFVDFEFLDSAFALAQDGLTSTSDIEEFEEVDSDEVILISDTSTVPIILSESEEFISDTSTTQFTDFVEDLKLDQFEDGSVEIASTSQEQDNSTQESQSVIDDFVIQKHQIIFSDFLAPLDYGDKEIANTQLRLSLAALSNKSGDKILVDYATDDSEWLNIGSINIEEEKSNADNGGYFLFAMPVLESWDEIDEMKIKVTYETVDNEFDDQKTKILFDALWLEVYADDLEDELLAGELLAEQLEEERMDYLRLKKEFDFDFLSEKKNFEVGEKPSFKFKFKKNRSLIAEVGEAIVGIFRDEYDDLEIEAKIVGRNSDELNKYLKVTHLGDGEIEVSFDIDEGAREFKPGKYEVELLINGGDLTEGRYIDFSQDFSWGVLALNVDKSIYVNGETSYVQIGVLDDGGHTICDAQLVLEIIAPDGGVAELTSDNGLIVNNPACGPDNVIDSPDYYAYYRVGEVGEYTMKLTAETENGIKEINDIFEVYDERKFSFERIGPTRIYPWADYTMTFNIVASSSFSGSLFEYVPKSFEIVGNEMLRRNKTTKQFEIINPKFKLSENENEKILEWQDLDLNIGDEVVITYTFDAPNISPEFFLLGPAGLHVERDPSTVPHFVQDDSTFVQDDMVIETRQWQIASDAEVQNILYESIAITPVGGTANTVVFY